MRDKLEDLLMFVVCVWLFLWALVGNLTQKPVHLDPPVPLSQYSDVARSGHVHSAKSYPWVLSTTSGIILHNGKTRVFAYNSPQTVATLTPGPGVEVVAPEADTSRVTLSGAEIKDATVRLRCEY